MKTDFQTMASSTNGHHYGPIRGPNGHANSARREKTKPQDLINRDYLVLGKDQPTTAKSIMRSGRFDDEGERCRFLEAIQDECAVLTSGNTVRYLQIEQVDDVMPIGDKQMPVTKRIPLQRASRRQAPRGCG